MPSVRLELTTFRLWDWRANQLRQEGLKSIMTQIAFYFHSKIMTRVHRTANRRVRCEQCEERTVRTSNSANNEQCEQFTLSEQCEQRTVRTVHIIRTVRTANSANSSHCTNSANSEQCEQFIFSKSSNRANSANRCEHCSVEPDNDCSYYQVYCRWHPNLVVNTFCIQHIWIQFA